MIEQVVSNVDTKAPHLTDILEKVSTLKSQFQHFELIQIPRELNQKADALAKKASMGECSRHSSISTTLARENPQVCSVTAELDCWMDLIIWYVTTSELPTNTKEAKLLRLRAQHYSIINGTLYRKSFNGPYLRCLRPT